MTEGIEPRHKDFQSFALPTELRHLDLNPVFTSGATKVIELCQFENQLFALKVKQHKLFIILGVVWIALMRLNS